MNTLRPTSEAELADAIATAAADSTRLRLVGGGTRQSLGQAIDTDQNLSVVGLSGIELYEPGSLNIVARAGTPLAEITGALNAENQMLAFEPMNHRALLGTSGTPTIGGMVATNTSGPRRILAGACRDHLLGVRFVNGTGAVLKNGGRVMKNVTGLDLAKLMCGAYGTLGVLTELSLKTLPRPETARTLAFAGLGVTQAAALFSKALRTPYEISGAAWAGGTAYLRLEGFEVQVSNRATQLSALFATQEIDQIEGDAHDALWAGIRNVAALADHDGSIWRLSTKATDAGAIVESLRSSLGATACLDWGGGLIWLAVPDGPSNASATIRDLAALYGGHATLIRGDDALRKTTPVFQPQAPTLARLSTGLRAQFDPKAILNPGLMG